MEPDRMTASEPLLITRSILSARALAQLLEQTYSLAAVQCQLIKAMILDTYRVTTSSGPFILRVYPHDRRTLAEITAELDFLAFLSAAGAPVSVPIPSRNGQRLLEIAAPEGTRYAA